MYLQFNLTFYWRAKRAYIVAILAILFKTGYFGYFLGLLATFEITLVHFGYLRCVWLLWLLFCGCGYFGYFLLRWRWNRGLTVSGNAGEYKVDFHKELQRLESVGVKMRFRLPSSASLSRATLLCSCCRKSKNDTLYFVSFLANNKRETTR